MCMCVLFWCVCVCFYVLYMCVGEVCMCRCYLGRQLKGRCMQACMPLSRGATKLTLPPSPLPTHRDEDVVVGGLPPDGLVGERPDGRGDGEGQDQRLEEEAAGLLFSNWLWFLGGTG